MIRGVLFMTLLGGEQERQATCLVQVDHQGRCHDLCRDAAGELVLAGPHILP